MTHDESHQELTPEDHAELRAEMDRLLAAEKALFYVPPPVVVERDPRLEALSALEQLVKSAHELSSAWETLSDTAFLDARYPDRLPSFDEFASELQDWLEDARAKLGE